MTTKLNRKPTEDDVYSQRKKRTVNAKKTWALASAEGTE
jgi:hypothetical protein